MREIDRLQYITPSGDEELIMRSSRQFLEGGGRWIQLRMKGSSREDFIHVGLKLREMCSSYGATFIINDSIEVARATKADGLHLGKSDMGTLAARSLLGSHAIIGRTANTIEDIKLLASEAIDYIGLGPFRFTQTKENLSPIIGLEGYQRIMQECKELGITMPIVSVGGIKEGDIRDIMDSGIYGVAVSGVVSHSGDIPTTTSEIINSIRLYK